MRSDSLRRALWTAWAVVGAAAILAGVGWLLEVQGRGSDGSWWSWICRLL